MTRKKKNVQTSNCIVRYEGTNTKDFTLVEISLLSMKPDTIISIMTTKEVGETVPCHRVNKIAANKGCDQKVQLSLCTGAMIRISLESGEMKYYAQYHVRSQEINSTWKFSIERDDIGLISCIIEGEGLAQTRVAPNVIPQQSLFADTRGNT